MPAKKSQRLQGISLGYEFLDPRVPNVSFRSTQTLLDRDVVLLRLGDLALEYSLDYGSRTYHGEPSLSDDSSFQIRADVDRRRGELQTLLELGRTLVLFLPPPQKWYVATGEVRYSGTGKNSRATRMVTDMQVFSALPFSVQTRSAVTRDLELRAGEPFASFWRANKDRFEAAAIMTEPFGDAALVIRGTDSVAASIASVAKGLVIVLPQDLLYSQEEIDLREEAAEADRESGPVSSPIDKEFIDSVFDLVSALRGSPGGSTLPEWAGRFVLPGETKLASLVRDAERNVERELSSLEDARRSLSRLEQRKALFAGSGRDLELIVEEALQALGFDVEDGKPNRTDRIARRGTDVVVIEIKGVAKSAGEKDSAQLEKWVSEFYMEHGVQPKPVLLVNGWRDLPPDGRSQPVFPDQMLPYAKARGHCLITGLQLLGAWTEAETNPARIDQLVRFILTSVGRYRHHTSWPGFLAAKQTTADEPASD